MQLVYQKNSLNVSVVCVAILLFVLTYRCDCKKPVILLQAIPNSGECSIIDLFQTLWYCSKYDSTSNQFYILFDINPGEGFNLRRDVYIRLIVFLKFLRNQRGYESAVLVLPPFRKLYHWRTPNIEQNEVFWNHFFDLNQGLKQYTNVLDIWEYFSVIQWKYGASKNINNVFHLQNYRDMFENGKFIEKFEKDKCRSDSSEKRQYYLNYRNLTTEFFDCINYQGNVLMLYDLFKKYVRRKSDEDTIILIEHAEIVLHDHWGDKEFWMARRSMRFNSILVETANQYRLNTFNSTNENDLVQRPLRWQDEKPYRSAIGGNYLCAHLRRADFLYGRDDVVPTLRSAAMQIKRELISQNLENIFISSDCTKQEFKDLRYHLMRFKVFRFTSDSFDIKAKLKDGGIAIIDQIICSHARFFIGTYESTFTYRIYEEREILGFPRNKTFNTFCKNFTDDKEMCQKNGEWPIVY